MPQNVEEAFAACGATLFPSSWRDLATDCSCPDWANPCKHVAAVFYLLAESFDEDPFRIFAWRGRTRHELLASLRGREGAALSGAVVAGGPGTGGWSLPLVSPDATGQGRATITPAPSPWRRRAGSCRPSPPNPTPSCGVSKNCPSMSAANPLPACWPPPTRCSPPTPARACWATPSRTKRPKRRARPGTIGPSDEARDDACPAG